MKVKPFIKKNLWNLVGVAVLIMLIVVAYQANRFFEIQSEIKEKCGFENEMIKCVCEKKAYDEFIGEVNLTEALEDG